MPEIDDYVALLEAVTAREPMFTAHQVARAIHARLDTDLDAANDVEPALERAGYIQTKRGDWLRL